MRQEAHEDHDQHDIEYNAAEKLFRATGTVPVLWANIYRQQ